MKWNLETICCEIVAWITVIAVWVTLGIALLNLLKG